MSGYRVMQNNSSPPSVSVRRDEHIGRGLTTTTTTTTTSRESHVAPNFPVSPPISRARLRTFRIALNVVSVIISPPRAPVPFRNTGNEGAAFHYFLTKIMTEGG
ncbi:hypothetical protein E2C01_048950 [Portunus trituberculatus]|uniref:Uncharacterized protein n=1 Tax=Portunus trituberculatus TaxID=210409 RepID=A0A5B7GBI9_PORTR|nr:hypothetical protein [Portunus trituberculatus]